MFFPSANISKLLCCSVVESFIFNFNFFYFSIFFVTKISQFV